MYLGTSPLAITLTLIIAAIATAAAIGFVVTEERRTAVRVRPPRVVPPRPDTARSPLTVAAHPVEQRQRDRLTATQGLTRPEPDQPALLDEYRSAA